MPCPYLKRGLFKAKCSLINKTVDLSKYPCLSENFETCPIYREKILMVSEKKEETKKFVEQSGKANNSSETKKSEEKEGLEVKTKVEADINCERCLFYSSMTQRCVKLGIKVKDPGNPPCGGKYFTEVG